MLKKRFTCSYSDIYCIGLQCYNDRMTATNELDGKFLTHLKFQILQEKRMELINNINPERHIDYLRSRFLFSEEDSQEIQCLTTRRKKAGLFLDILLRNPKGFDNLCESLLIEKTQIFLLEMLNKEFEKRLKIYKDLMQQPNGNTDIDVPINVDKRALPRPSSNRHNDSDSKDKLNSRSTRSPQDNVVFILHYHGDNMVTMDVEQVGALITRERMQFNVSTDTKKYQNNYPLFTFIVKARMGFFS